MTPDASAAIPRLLAALPGFEPPPPGAVAELADVTPTAQAAVVAAVLQGFRGKGAWVLCPDAKRQEQLAADLETWGVPALSFPELEDLGQNAIPDPEALSERLEILARIAGGEGAVIATTPDQMDLPVPAPSSFREQVLRLAPGSRMAPEQIEADLLRAGYERATKIGARGQFVRRGGILDVYSPQHPLPVRIEFFGDDIDSLREFGVDSQVSVRPLDRCEILLGDPDALKVPMSAYVGEDDLVVSVDCGHALARVRVCEGPAQSPVAGSARFDPPGVGIFSAGDFVLDEVRRREFFREISEWLSGGWRVVLACATEGEAGRFAELCRDNGVDPAGIETLLGTLGGGFVCAAAKIAVLTDAELFGRAASMRARHHARHRERAQAARSGMDFTEFEPGDLVVHQDHGIGKFLGMEKPGEADGSETLAIAFDGDSRLFVPLDQAWKVSRYVGLGKKNPSLSALGDARWERAKRKAERSIFEYAASMLKLQAERETAEGHACPPDSPWQREFEGSFFFKETPDQLRAIAETKTDMESRRPMDRLVCGDVGFGKTEVAIRAAFKAVMGGKQVAFLAPTTVLAQQHWQTLRERASDYPVRVDALHRFRPRAEQTKTLKGLATGEVDIVVGTHRLLSADVKFKGLGLVVVDEEQRFGVKHKDLLKERFRLVDVLTLSATPIPRTLYLALMGARDMSLIETPPQGRQPVETTICAYDERVIRDAVAREIRRGGQVYLLHNRVRTIERVAARIRELVPEARVLVGHGQMAEHELEDVMAAFVAGEADVLVSTTIIESGLDIPNANTIVIDRADRFGLADLYQLRGRVGRSHQKAYAYLMLPRDLMAGGDARKRVAAIRQYSELGAGFKIAMRDLEIRGAGNLLGTAQSGHILAVGFDLYCRMLKRAVDTLSGGAPVPAAAASTRLDFVCGSEPEFAASPGGSAPAFLPSGFMAAPADRIEAARRLASAADEGALDSLEAEWRDRFGPLPRAAANLLVLQRIRLAAAARRIRVVETRDDKLMLSTRADYILFGKKFPRLTASDPENKLREILEFLEKRIR